MSEELIVGSDESDKEEDFDGYEFIVELVDDDDEVQVEEGQAESPTIPDAGSSDGGREFFKYVDGFLTKSKQEKQEEEKKRQQELIEKKGLFKCSICGKFFLYRSKCHHHLVHDHNVDKGNRLNCWVIDEADAKSDRPMIPCHICGKTYQMKDSLARHIKIKHTDYKKIKCPMCPTEFTQKSDVERHIRRKHSECIDRGSEMGEDYQALITASTNLMQPFNAPNAIVKPELRDLPNEGSDTMQSSYLRKSRVEAMIEDAMNGKKVDLEEIGGLDKRNAPIETSESTPSKVNNLASDFDKASSQPVGSEFDRIVIKAEKDDVDEIRETYEEPVAIKAEPVDFDAKVKKPSSTRTLVKSGPSPDRDIPEYVEPNSKSSEVKKQTSKFSKVASPASDPPSGAVSEAMKQPANPHFLAALSYSNMRKRTREIVNNGEAYEDFQRLSKINGEALLEKDIRCSICSLMLKSRALFVNHLVRKHGIDEVQANSNAKDWIDNQIVHQCKSCPFTSKNKEELKRHIEARHKVLFNWAWEKNMDVTECSADHNCPLCGKAYMEEADMHAHMIRYHGKRKKVEGHISAN